MPASAFTPPNPALGRPYVGEISQPLLATPRLEVAI